MCQDWLTCTLKVKGKVETLQCEDNHLQTCPGGTTSKEEEEIIENQK